MNMPLIISYGAHDGFNMENFFRCNPVANTQMTGKMHTSRLRREAKEK